MTEHAEKDWSVRERTIGTVCEKGNHFSPDVEGGGCGSNEYASVSIVTREFRPGRGGVTPPIDDIVEEINMALVFFAAHGRPGWVPK